MFKNIKAVVKIEKITCVFVLYSDWRPEDLCSVVAEFKEMESICSLINAFFNLRNFSHVVIITDLPFRVGVAYGTAFPIFRAYMVPIYLFFYPQSIIYDDYHYNSRFILIHEYAHLLLSKLLYKTCGIISVLTIPTWLEESFCDAVGLMFGNPNYHMKIMLRCIYLQYKWLTRCAMLESTVKRVYQSIYIGTIIESIQEKIFLQVLVVEKELRFKPKLSIKLKITWRTPPNCP